MTTDKVNLGPEIRAICKKLGLEPTFTKSIHLTPTQAEVVTYLKDANGRKYLEPTSPYMTSTENEDITSFSSTPATTTTTYEVRT